MPLFTNPTIRVEQQRAFHLCTCSARDSRTCTHFSARSTDERAVDEAASEECDSLAEVVELRGNEPDTMSFGGREAARRAEIGSDDRCDDKNARVILVLYVGALLAAETKCKGSVISNEVKQQILDYHTARREGDAVEWECELEAKARGILKKGGKIDTSRVGRGRGVNVYEIKKEVETTKDLVNRVLGQWWSSSKETNLNILVLCVGASFAAETKCKGSVISSEVKKQILNLHLVRREGNAMEWECELEAKARGLLKKGGKVDTSRVGNGRGVNVREYKKETAWDFARRALEQWWSSRDQTSRNMRDTNNKKVGCSYKDGKEDFLIACLYEK
ncbi:hypothetical protein Aduo_003290 [Ancylostoma duodenale]